jgi:threonine dehydrogenase-like Zn-dependent dehydrogenase
MKAICWHGTHDVRCDNVADPGIVEPGDAIVRITSTAICGSDLHLYDGLMPTMESGDVLGHEPIGYPDKLPFGALMNKGLTVKTGQTHVAKYHRLLLAKIEAGEIDPSFIVTHTEPLKNGPAMYKTFRDKRDHCIKVVLKP